MLQYLGDRLGRWIGRHVAHSLAERIRLLMTPISDLRDAIIAHNAKLDEHNTAVTELLTTVGDEVGEVNQKLDELRALIPAEGEIAELVASIADSTARLTAATDAVRAASATVEGIVVPAAPVDPDQPQ